MAITLNGDGLITVDGTSSTQGRVRLAEDTDNGSNYIELTAPASVGSNRTITMPDATTTLIGTDTTDTLTNKTLTSPTLTTPNINSAQVETVSGTAPLYMCRAWVNFDGTTNTGGNCTIRASGNVSTVADNGTGDYTVNFTTAMPDANYCAIACMQESGSNFSSVATIKNSGTVSPTSSAVRFSTFGWTAGNAGAVFDPPIVNVEIVR